MFLYKQKGSRNWYLGYYRNGKVWGKSTRTADKKLAQSILKQKQAQNTLGLNDIVVVGNSPTLSDAVTKFLLSKKRRRKTVIAYHQALKHLYAAVGNKPINLYDDNDYLTLLSYLDNHTRKGKALSQNSIANYTRHLHAIFSWLHKRGDIKKNFIIVAEEEEKDVNPIEPDVLQRILEYLKDMPKQLTLIKLSYLFALRISEAINLTVTQFDFNNMVLKVSGKAKRIDSVPILQDAEEYLKTIELNNGRLFDYAGYDSVKTFWNTMNKKLNLHVKFHGLRKARGTDLANIGVEPLFLHKFMRHRNFETTLKYYIKVDMNNMRSKINDKLPIVETIIGNNPRGTSKNKTSHKKKPKKS